jgi:glutamate:GABA antiporter
MNSAWRGGSTSGSPWDVGGQRFSFESWNSIMLSNTNSGQSASSRQESAMSQGLDLPSQYIRQGWLPQIFGTKDLTIFCLFAVLLISNVSLIAGAGAAAYIYWIIGFLVFLIPSALICFQLYRLFPGEGAVYLWANKAFGSFWDTFLGFFCNWWPGGMSLTIDAASVVTYIQAINPNWLTSAWQQGIVELLVLVLAFGLCSLDQRVLKKILSSVFYAYGAIVLLVGIAGLVWLVTGHAPQGNFSSSGWRVSVANWPVLATVVVSLLGMAVPLNMGMEMADRRRGPKYLLWAVVIVIVGYLIATLGILVVLPPQDATNSALIATVFSQVFGPVGSVFAVIVNIILIVYFVCATAAFNMMFARLLLVAGVDRRLPRSMARLNQRGIPFNALLTQTVVNAIFVVFVFLVGPFFFTSNQLFSTSVFLVTINGASVVWNIAMIGLFLCGIILFIRYRAQLQGKWIVPPIVLYIAAILGMASSCVAIYSTFFAGSPLPTVLSNSDWVYWVLLVALGSLAVGAVYSFLVPEAEDLVALLARNRSEQQKRTLTPPPNTSQPLSGMMSSPNTSQPLSGMMSSPNAPQSFSGLTAPPSTPLP